MSFPRVAIIILNWNNWRDTIECIESVSKIIYPNYNIILIDNGSSNDSVTQIKYHFKGVCGERKQFVSNLSEKYLKYTVLLTTSKVSESNQMTPKLTSFIFLELHENLGFSEGNNIGILCSRDNLHPDYYLLLNNDVVVEQNFLSVLVEAAEKNPHVGFVGPKTYYYDYNGLQDVIEFGGGMINFRRGLPVVLDHGRRDECHSQKIAPVDYIQGSCILVKKNVIEEIGLLDPKYFFYWEDSDWCIRGKMNKWLSLYAPGSKIWHKGGMSSNGHKSRFSLFYFTRNRLVFMKKYSPKKRLILFFLYYFGGEFLKTCVYYVFKGDFQSLQVYLKANIMGLI